MVRGILLSPCLTSIFLGENKQAIPVPNRAATSRLLKEVERAKNKYEGQGIPSSHVVLAGMGHFMGSDSVLELLRKEGWLLTPIMVDWDYPAECNKASVIEEEDGRRLHGSEELAGERDEE